MLPRSTGQRSPREAARGPGRPDPGDPASHRPFAARGGRYGSARGTYGHRRLRCHSGRWRTRTAAITGGYVALVDAVSCLRARPGRSGRPRRDPIHGAVAAVSVGIYKGETVLDLDYVEDSEAETDMNVVMNDAGGFIEIQGTAEGHAFRRTELDAMLDLARDGIASLVELQRTALAGPRVASRQGARRTSKAGMAKSERSDADLRRRRSGCDDTSRGRRMRRPYGLRCTGTGVRRA